MRFCRRGRNRHGSLSIASRLWVRRRALAGNVTNKSPRFGTLCVNQSIVRIELNCTIEESDGFTVIIDVAALEVEMALEVSVMCFHAVRGDLSRPFLRAEQSDPE